MKISPKINKRVNKSVAECRRVLTDAIIELSKSIGAENGQDISINPVPVVIPKIEHHGRITYETRVFNTIAYEDNRQGYQYFMVSGEYGAIETSTFMPVDGILAVYDSLKKTVGKE